MFIIYILIPVMSSFRKKLSFKNTDIVLMALNTVISSLLLYSAFYIVKMSDFTGLLAIVFAIVYLSLGKFVEKFMTKEQKVRELFYITGLTFIVLIIPFQFGKVWLSLGWLVEGITLLSYGIYKELKDFKKAGVIISLLCFSAFIVFDVSSLDNSLFVYKYLAITADMILVSFLMTYIIPRIRILCDNVIKAISVIIYVIALIDLFFLNFSSPVRGLLYEVTGAISIIGTIELVVITILAILALRNLILCFVIEEKLGIQWDPIIISSYFIVVLTQNLIN